MATVDLTAGSFRQPGALAEPQLELLIDKARDLDMDDVRRRLAATATN